MNKETALKLLWRFVDPNHTSLALPFSQELKIGKYLCATNAKSVLLIPATEDIKFNDPEEVQLKLKQPNLNGILPNFKAEDEIVIDFKQILQLYNDIPFVEKYKMEECESCDGDGSFRHYGNEYECKKCDGHGETQTCHLEKIKNPNTVFRFKETDVEIKYISEMIHVFNILKPKTFSIVKLSNSIFWVKFDNIYMGNVAKFNMDDEDKKYDIINFKFN